MIRASIVCAPVRSLAPSLALVSLVSLAACARSSSPPLPGDSVSADGAVTLSPPRMSTAPSPAPRAASAAEPIGAIESKLYPAELIMDHQADIGLEPAQRDAITKEVDRGQAELVRIQWELQAEKEKLVKILSEPKVDEAKSKQAAAQVMERENKIKAAHLSMLVRIKNVLTPAQQEKLRAAREAERCGTPSPSSAPSLASPSPSHAPPAAPSPSLAPSPSTSPSRAPSPLLDDRR